MTRYVGRPIRRVEDYRFLTGAGRYTDDIRLEGHPFSICARSRQQGMEAVHLLQWRPQLLHERRFGF